MDTTPRMFAQITKIDAAKREVWGRLAHEVPDRADEIFDYESSKPYFKAWSDEFAKATDGKSLGNLRAMHGKTAAGKFIAVNFNDAEKAIDVGAKVVDDNEWKKCEEGVYTGFSIGGSYVGERKAEKVDGRDVKRYTANPAEGSLVDAPCIPTAKFFDVIKADGMVEKVAFKVPALEVTGTDDEVAEFADALNAAKLTMSDAIALVKAHKPADPTKPTQPMDKGMWNVQDFASVLASVSNIAAMAKDEAEWEGDKSPVPEKLRTWLKAGVDIFKAMAKEEADELVATLKVAAGKSVGVMLELHKLGTGDDLAKAATMQKVHDMLGELGAKCGKDVPAGDLAKVSGELAAALERIAKLEKQPVPYVTLRAIAKGAPQEPDAAEVLAGITIESLTDVEKLKNLDGTIDYQSSLLQKREKALMAMKPKGNS
jgi:hypothetical protein